MIQEGNTLHSDTHYSRKHKQLTNKNSPIPNIAPDSINFVVSFGSLYINKTTPKIYSN